MNFKQKKYFLSGLDRLQFLDRLITFFTQLISI